MPITSTGLVSGINFDSIISQIQDSEKATSMRVQWLGAPILVGSAGL